MEDLLPNRRESPKSERRRPHAPPCTRALVTWLACEGRDRPKSRAPAACGAVCWRPLEERSGCHCLEPLLASATPLKLPSPITLRQPGDLLRKTQRLCVSTSRWVCPFVCAVCKATSFLQKLVAYNTNFRTSQGTHPERQGLNLSSSLVM